TQECPLVVIDCGTSTAMTFVVLDDNPLTFRDQAAVARPNFAAPVKLALKLLCLENDPECEKELAGKIGRSEGKVAVATPGELKTSQRLLRKLGTVSLE